MTREASTEASPGSLADLGVVFLRLGFTAFGGPAAHIAILENEFVRRRRWLTHERFLDLLGASNLIPGPSSTELAIYIGYEQAGWPGLVLGGVCFILPAALMVSAIAWAYVRFGTLPHFAAALYGIKPVVIVIVVQALRGLAPKALKSSKLLGVVGGAACIASILGVDPVLVLASTGIVTAMARSRADGAMKPGASQTFGPAFAATAGAAGAAAPPGLLAILLAFVKIGALVFGSGYVLLAFLRADLVDRLHWLTELQVLDAVAIGQVTPGPVFTTATFIGYVIGGPRGAVLATVGIFLPGFVLVAVTRPLISRIRQSPTASAFFDGVNVASLALMAVVTVLLARAALVDIPTLLIAALGAVPLLRWKVSSTWLIAGAALVGVCLDQRR